MLDLKKIDKIVTELISNATKEDFESWLIKDEQRMVEAFVFDGQPISYTNKKYREIKVQTISCEPAPKAGFLFNTFSLRLLNDA